MLNILLHPTPFSHSVDSGQCVPLSTCSGFLFATMIVPLVPELVCIGTELQFSQKNHNLVAEETWNTAHKRKTTHHSRGGVDHLLRLQVALVAHQQLVHVLAGVALDLLQPLFDVVERLLVGAVVHHDDAVRAPVVRRRYRTEALLAGRVPLCVFGEGKFG